MTDRLDGLPDHTYGERFYQYLQESSGRSARIVVPKVLEALAPASILDVGCGAGAWLVEYMRNGVADVLGLDGDYVRQDQLLVPKETFRPTNVGMPFDVGRRFAMVQCLEVAEHLRPEQSDTLIGNLTRHGHVVLFSAALPGQGGENHINEQDFEFWRQLFAGYGYVPFDFLRPQLSDKSEVEPWYRYNVLLYVSTAHTDSLGASVAATRVPETLPIKDVAPIATRWRRGILRLLPHETVTRLARLKHTALTR